MEKKEKLKRLARLLKKWRIKLDDEKHINILDRRPEYRGVAYQLERGVYIFNKSHAISTAYIRYIDGMCRDFFKEEYIKLDNVDTISGLYYDILYGEEESVKMDRVHNDIRKICFGAFLKDTRLKLGYSGNVIAKLSGVSQVSISQYERGQNDFNISPNGKSKALIKYIEYLNSEIGSDSYIEDMYYKIFKTMDDDAVKNLINTFNYTNDDSSSGVVVESKPVKSIAYTSSKTEKNDTDTDTDTDTVVSNIKDDKPTNNLSDLDFIIKEADRIRKILISELGANPINSEADVKSFYEALYKAHRLSMTLKDYIAEFER